MKNIYSRVTLLIFILSACCFFSSSAQVNILQNSASKEQVSTYLNQYPKFDLFPAYGDRNSWDALFGANKQSLILAGEKLLDYEWKVVKATDYLEFERSGSRVVMEKPYNANNFALSNLMIAELAEGRGRFMDQIINGVWQTCDMKSWVLSAHLPTQKTRRSLPDEDDIIIDLTSGDIGSLLSWAHYFFEASFNKVDPTIDKRIRNEIDKRILRPYLQRNDLWWQALEEKPGQMVNNWNPWCNSNVLIAFLLMEKNQQRKLEGVYKTMISADQFINYTKNDGACEEGPSYWGHAAGKMYDYLQLLSYATHGKLNVFHQQKIKNMGEYIARSYIGEGWVVNFADATALAGGNPGLVYRFGKAVGSDEMMQFASYLSKREKENKVEGRDIFRSIENFRFAYELNATEPHLVNRTFTWYPQTEFCYMRAGTAFLGIKGGYNAESHNHNDVGTFIYFLDNTPFLVDAGVGTYTKKTFSNERYSIWTMQSDYHNLPKINGYSQEFGAKYKSKSVTADSAANTFALDISGAYSAKAGVKSWKMDYKMDAKGSFELNHHFELDNVQDVNQLRFLAAVTATELKPGLLQMENKGRKLQISYNPKDFDFSLEKIVQEDSKLSSVWGTALYQIRLTAKKMAKKGGYTLKFTPL